MKLSDLIFTGFNRRVAALNRETGHIVWSWKAPKGSSYVSLLLDGDLLIAGVNGHMYGLDALTGRERWANEMVGFGFGVTSIASLNGGASFHHLMTAAAATAQSSAASAGTSGGAAASA